jgi:DnaJ like chaperone protein
MTDLLGRSESAIVRPAPMSIWSRIVDVLSGFGGSVIGFLNQVAKSRRAPPDPQSSVAFTIGMIALGAKMAKADGVVTGAEISAFKEVFHIAPKELANVARVFNLAKQEVAGYDAYAKRVGKLFSRRPQVLEDVLDGLFHIAKADGRLHEREVHYLQAVARIFGFAPRDFARIRARHVKPQRSDPYLILGVDAGASDAEIRKVFRKLVRDNHPDRHIAAGVPPELVAIATEKLAAITNAYAQILRERAA